MKSVSNRLVVTLTLITAMTLPGALLAASHPESPSVEPEHRMEMSTLPMQRQMERMHEEMTRIREAKDPDERREFMQQHAKSMQGMMKMMHGMMAGQSMIGGRHGASTKMEPAQQAGDGNDRGMEPHATTPDMGAVGGRLGMMEQRMNMMQLMMDQMLQHQELHLQVEKGD